MPFRRSSSVAAILLLTINGLLVLAQAPAHPPLTT
jgi:hypothetical protein